MNSVVFISQSAQQFFETKGAPPSELREMHPFDFVSRFRRGDALLVGEGNLSFAVDVATRLRRASNVIATTFEANDALSAFGKSNVETLRLMGVKVLHGIDGTRLFDYRLGHFETIVFQFPNLADRRSVYGRTANHHLLRRFLRSCKKVLRPSGYVLVTTVDNPHYHGVFDVLGAAKATGYNILAVHPFFRTHCPKYRHENTLDVASALRASYGACTWVLKQQ